MLVSDGAGVLALRGDWVGGVDIRSSSTVAHLPHAAWQELLFLLRPLPGLRCLLVLVRLLGVGLGCGCCKGGHLLLDAVQSKMCRLLVSPTGALPNSTIPC